jgi:hypothetical protein
VGRRSGAMVFALIAHTSSLMDSAGYAFGAMIPVKGQRPNMINPSRCFTNVGSSAWAAAAA